LTGDLGRLYTELLPAEAVPEKTANTVRKYRNAEGLLNTCIALDIPKERLASEFGMRASNYWCFDSYDADGLYKSVREAEDAAGAFGCYITSASLKDPETNHAPDGMSTVEVLTVVPQDFAKWGTTEDELASGRYRKNSKYLELKKATEEHM